MTRVMFEIDHMDPLGQGVSRDGKMVTFIAGTLPGEKGSAIVYKKSKGVQFARLETLDKAASNRCEPQCPHSETCPGCHYLHTDYASELAYKRATLTRQLAHLNITDDEIDLVPAPHRLAYRNRVQLHYRHKYIGMMDTVNNKVVEIPQCQIIQSDLKPSFDALYSDKSWAEQHTGHGHCELYTRNGVVSEQWNLDYAHGGFSQVYEEMDVELQTRVQAQLKQSSAAHVLDLFSGRGNLSNTFSACGGERVLVDNVWSEDNNPAPDNFVKLDLYGEDSLRGFHRRHSKYNFDTLLIDPPRRGFPLLDSWVKRFKPEQLIYVSCNPASLARDLRNLKSKKYTVKTVQLLDLFPATYHFETLIVLQF